MRAIELLHEGTEHVICAWEVDGVIVDPGPASCLDRLLAALDGEAPRAILLTHIHFDHAGATGSLLERFPGTPVYVHERGARHMADPSRLVASAARLYGGEDGLRALWGEVNPVPAEHMTALAGGEREIEGMFRVEYTPGHASHHVCYLHEPSGWAFVGDVGGVRVAPETFTLAPTPPPDIDVEAWERSLDLVAGWSPEGLALTHWGPSEDAAAQLERCREALHAEVELAARTDRDGFVAELDERIRAATSEGSSLAAAAPLDQLYQGLDRWRRKREEAAD